MPERREAARQIAMLKGGRRETDPVLTPADGPELLGMTAAFLRGEIEDGRLHAIVYTPPPDPKTGKRRRRVYRFSPRQFNEYVARYWRQTESTASNARSASTASAP